MLTENGDRCLERKAGTDGEPWCAFSLPARCRFACSPACAQLILTIESRRSSEVPPLHAQKHLSPTGVSYRIPAVTAFRTALSPVSLLEENMPDTSCDTQGVGALRSDPRACPASTAKRASVTPRCSGHGHRAPRCQAAGAAPPPPRIARAFLGPLNANASAGPRQLPFSLGLAEAVTRGGLLTEAGGWRGGGCLVCSGEDPGSPAHPPGHTLSWVGYLGNERPAHAGEGSREESRDRVRSKSRFAGGARLGRKHLEGTHIPPDPPAPSHASRGSGDAQRGSGSAVPGCSGALVASLPKTLF